MARDRGEAYDVNLFFSVGFKDFNIIHPPTLVKIKRKGIP
jgi:hypothetical protein